jgi:hypothetical protein
LPRKPCKPCCSFSLVLGGALACVSTSCLSFWLHADLHHQRKHPLLWEHAW